MEIHTKLKPASSNNRIIGQHMIWTLVQENELSGNTQLSGMAAKETKTINFRAILVKDSRARD
jgi:hypothetical protein